MNKEEKEIAAEDEVKQPKKFVGINGKDLCAIETISTKVHKSIIDPTVANPNGEQSYTTICKVVYSFIVQKKGYTDGIPYIYPTSCRAQVTSMSTNVNGDKFDFATGKSVALSKCMTKIYNRIIKVQAKNVELLKEFIEYSNKKALLADNMISKEERFISNI